MLTIPFPNFVVIGPELMLVVSALFIITWEMITRTRDHRVSVALAAAGTGAALWLDLATWGWTGSTFLDAVALDPFASFVKAAVLVSLLLALALSRRALAEEGVEEHAEYYGLLLLAGAGMCLLAGARELITIFMALELLSISLYVLCGFYRHDVRSNEAAVKYFILGSFGTGFLLFGMSYLYGTTGTTHLAGIARELAVDPALAHSKALLLGLLLTLAGFAFKISAVPFHQWTPDVYEGAPTPVTAFMSTATKAAALAALVRLLVEGFLPLAFAWETLFAALAVLTMTVGNLGALMQDNVKRMLAYSSIAHAGYLLIALAVAGSGAPESALSSILFYLLAYALMNTGAFALVVLLRQGRPAGAGEMLSDYAGLACRRPWVAMAMLVFLFSLAGVPPFAGFAAKLGIFAAAVEAKAWFLLAVGIVNSAVAAFYYLRVVVVMYMHEASQEAAGARVTIDPVLGAGMAAAAVGTLLLGILPGFVFEAARAAVTALLG